MTAQSYSGLEYVIINLGINDVFTYKTDADLVVKIAEMLTQYSRHD